MPTGYTACIANGGVTFEKFAMGCMRAFGACMDQRDEPGDVLPRKRKLDSTYHRNGIRAAKRLKARAKNVGSTLLSHQLIKQLQHDYKYHTEAARKSRQLTSEYNRLLTTARTWVPPSKEHIEFKKFMIEQLESSIKFDDMASYHDEQANKVFGRLLDFSPAKERREMREKAAHDLAHHTKERAKEVKRVIEGNRWIQTAFNAIHNKK